MLGYGNYFTSLNILQYLNTFVASNMEFDTRNDKSLEFARIDDHGNSFQRKEIAIDRR